MKLPKVRHDLPKPPKWLALPLCLLAMFIVVRIIIDTPILLKLHHAHPILFAMGILGSLLLVWAVALWRRRNSTPECIKEVLVFLGTFALGVWVFGSAVI